jgi:hypothetical protein
MSKSPTLRPLMRRPWFVSLVVIGCSLFLLVGLAWLAISNSGAMMASVPVRVPIDAQAEYAKAHGRLQASTDELTRKYALGNAALWSIDVGKLDDAERFANELLALNQRLAADWDAGNAVHKAHSVLGRLALKRGDVAEAERQLKLVATSKGSPQLDTFGPNMTLVRDLLETKQPSAKAAALAYLDHLPTFWKMDRGAITVWRADIERGVMPNFGAHLLF